MWMKDGKPFSGTSVIVGNRRIFNPSDATMLASGYHWEEPPAPEPPPKRYSRLKIVRVLGEAWPEYKAQIEAAGLLDEFTYAEYLAEDDPVFSAFLESVPEEVKELLDECLWDD